MGAILVYTVVVYTQKVLGMGAKLPICKKWISTDAAGRTCIVEIQIERTSNLELYPPDGVKSIFTIRREKRPGCEDFELVILIDNHAPFGFHEHPRLPNVHNYRRTIHTIRWQDAWLEFEKRLQEILDEA